jgi:hypothetical protein
MIDRPYIDIDIKGMQFINRLMMLDIVANNWKRPINFSGGAFDNELSLDERHLQLTVWFIN